MSFEKSIKDQREARSRENNGGESARLPYRDTSLRVWNTPTNKILLKRIYAVNEQKKKKWFPYGETHAAPKLLSSDYACYPH